MTRAQVTQIEKAAALELKSVQAAIQAIEDTNIWDDEIDAKYEKLNNRESELEIAGKNAWLTWNRGEILKSGGSLRADNIR